MIEKEVKGERREKKMTSLNSPNNVSNKTNKLTFHRIKINIEFNHTNNIPDE